LGEDVFPGQNEIGAMVSIGFVCESNPLSRKSWSGIHYTLFTILKKEYRIEWINSDPLSLKIPLKIWVRVMRLFGKNVDWMHMLFYSRALGWATRMKLRNRKFDVLYLPAGSASLAFLKTDISIVYHSDTTFRLVHGYYREYSRLSKRNANSGEILEQRSLHKSTRIILTSDWAKRSAVEDYGVKPEKIEVIPFVPNIESIPPISEIHFGKTDSLNLLFVGADWKRKGGSKAIAIYRLLKTRYGNCRLRLVGGTPDETIDDPGIEYLGFINKNDPVALARLCSLYLDSDFFLLPTSAESSAVVYTEASAFGVPILTFDTGGVANYVEDNVNGFRFPPGTQPSVFAEVITTIYENPARFESLRRSTRQKYENEFSSTTWLARFAKMLAEMGIE
jgi:glycosyltransferase involved in cell wall biosynthesis